MKILLIDDSDSITSGPCSLRDFECITIPLRINDSDFVIHEGNTFEIPSLSLKKKKGKRRHGRNWHKHGG